ncbi:helix-turn-helix domain-containing protein [Streptomyces sp. 4F14]|uniref:helix-turn-helix domain-containing protein n=1 Tax=Streptomyces sp. 4F14 TaxID=3394380 RepID=UPI003A8B81CF
MIIARPDQSCQKLIVEERVAGHDSDTWTYQLPDQWFGIVTPIRGVCQIEGRENHGWLRTTLGPGEVCLVAPNNLVRLSRTPPRRLPFEVVHIQLSVEVLQRALDTHTAASVRDVSELQTLRAFDPHVASMAQTLLHARKTGAGERYDLSAAHYLAEYLLHPRHDASPRTGGLSPEQLQTVTTFMSANFSSSITLDQLAKEAGLSRYHFLRRFSAATGKTPLQYLTELRIEAACYLLTVDNDPVSQVGRRCGFPNPEHFARVFRKHVGCAPSQYRQQGQRVSSPSAAVTASS